nr:MAG TPA: hypothetical protein [Caudoviricetes sp.]
MMSLFQNFIGLRTEFKILLLYILPQVLFHLIRNHSPSHIRT